jgi:hypothetical protein
LERPLAASPEVPIQISARPQGNALEEGVRSKDGGRSLSRLSSSMLRLQRELEK